MTVDIAGTGSGGVTSSPSGINCSGSNTSCAASFTSGAAVTLTATPTSGHTFVGWTGICSGTGMCQFNAVDGALAIARFDSPTAAAVTYYHLDAIGSVRALTDASGTVVIRHDYFPFGEDTQAMTGDPLRFTGQEIDAESGQHYFQARQYRNIWGRFTTVDPGHVNGSLEDPQGWNGYAYGRNNPLKYSDPDGRRYSFCLNRNCKIMSDLDFDLWLANPGDGITWDGSTGIIEAYSVEVGRAYQIDADEYEFYIVARPIDVTLGYVNHGAAFIVDQRGNIIRQYSLQRNSRVFDDQNSTSFTFTTDRDGFFRSGLSPDDSFQELSFLMAPVLFSRHEVTVPGGMTTREFALRVVREANRYDEDYSVVTQNSTSAAAGIFYRAGADVPHVPRAPGLRRWAPP